LVTAIGIRFRDKIDIYRIIEMFVGFDKMVDLWIYMSNMLPYIDKADSHPLYLKYLQVCAKTCNFKEMERIIQHK